jgi:hypothetical protein
MNSPWVIRLSASDHGALAALRLTDGIEVAVDGASLWLRSRKAGEEMTGALRRLPAVARYEWLGEHRLRPWEARIPSERLPSLRWEPLAGWMRVQTPVASSPAWPPAPAGLRLVRTGDEQAPDLLQTSLTAWADFVEQAAFIRLQPLRFAADERGQVLVRGTPLPPLSGQRFVVQGDVAVPAGFTWAPAVSRQVLQRRLGLVPGQLALWYPDGRYCLLHAELLIPATRSSVRATVADAGAAAS